MMAVMIITANTYGQYNCDEAIPLTSFNTSQDYYTEYDSYWISFTADSIDFYLALLPTLASPSTLIKIINLYRGDDCGNLSLEKTIDIQIFDSILSSQLQIGYKYYIEIMRDGSSNGFFTLYCANFAKSSTELQCIPKYCNINPNADFDDLSLNLINALNGSVPDPILIFNPMCTPQFSDVCNWRNYTGTPQIATEVGGNNLLYMWAQRTDAGYAYQESTYNKLSNIIGPTGIGLLTGHNYTLSLKYKEHFTQGVEGFKIYMATEDFTGSLSNLLLVVDFPLNTLPNTTGFNNISFPIPAIPNNSINYNTVLIYPYQLTGINSAYGGLSIDDFVITEDIPITPITITLGENKPCGNENVNFYYQIPATSGITYTWIIPNNAVITSNPSPNNNILVNWNNAGIATIIVEGRDINGCLLYQGSLLFDPNSSPCPDATYSINNINSTQIKALFGVSSTITTNQLININGTITINENINFDACSNINLGANAKINVMPGCTLNITNSILKACFCSWDGIYVESPTASLNIENSSFSGAKNAVVSSNNGKIYLYYSTFADNNIGTWIRKYNPEPRVDEYGNIILPLPHSAVISKCKYECINNAYVGIVIDTVYNVTIGDVSTTTNMNEFKKLTTGIISTSSDVNIYNNYFNNNCFSNVSEPYYIYSEPRDAAIFIKRPYYQGPQPLPNTTAIQNIVTIGGAATNYANVFYLQNIGIYGFNTQVNIYNNIFTEQRFSTVHLRDLYKSDIKYNTISMQQNGTWASNNLYNSSILAEHSVATATVWLDISNNIINNTRTGINTRNCNGDNGNNYFSNVKNNTINFSTIDQNTSHKYFGISASNNGYAVIESNNMSFGTDPIITYHDRLYGIYLSTVTNSKVSLNRTGRMGDGIYIAGTSLGSQYFCNDLYKCWNGFYFYYPTLSYQLLNPIGNNTTSDNYWTDISPVTISSALRRMEGDLSYSSYQANWYHRALTNDINNTYSPYILLGDLLSNKIIPQQNQAANANCFSWFEMNPSGREALLGDIVRDSMNYQVLPDENEYMCKEFAYKTLDKEPASLALFVPEDSLYQNFYTTTRLSNVGKNDEVSKAVNNKDYTTALNLNATIVPQNTIETNRKIVHGIYLEKLVNNIKLPAVDSLTLLAIAMQTPYEGGDAVYAARVILGIDPLQYNLAYTKPPVHKPLSTTEKEELKVYPNPANDKLNIELSNALEGLATIEIYDLNSRLCYSTNINMAQKLQSINISGIKKGIYNLKIKTTNKTENQKLVIIK